ncbi:MAG: TraM recognition domain-containing protein [Solirubrobacterales bacterium]
MTRGQGNVALAIGAHLWAIAMPLLIGVALGAIVLVVLRRRGLRWTWALWGAPIAYLVWFIDWHVGLLLAFATIAAVWFGARDHAEVVQRGGEEARAVRDTLGPLRWAILRLRGARVREAPVKDGRLAIGVTRSGAICRVPIGVARGVHCLIAGATGSGKTVSASAFLEAYVAGGFGALNVDPKGDEAMRERARAAAERAGVAFHEWNPTGPCVYNPLARGGPTEIADKALSAHSWSEPHYELATQRLLGHVLATMQAAGLWPPSLSAVVAHMDPERLDALASKVGGEVAERVHAYVDGMSQRAKADLGGGRDRLAVLADSELGRWLDPAHGDGEAIDLAVAFAAGDVVYFNLDADRYPAAAKLIASALIVDLVGLAAEMQGRGPGGLVVIDEFAAIAPEKVSRLFARARSAQLSIALLTQSLADMRAARPDDPSDTLTEQVLANVEFIIAHRIGDPDSAERFARMGGTVPAWSMTQRVDASGMALPNGEGTRTRQRDFLVLPDQFKRLAVGQAVVIDPSVRPMAQIVRIWPPGGGRKG